MSICFVGIILGSVIVSHFLYSNSWGYIAGYGVVNICLLGYQLAVLFYLDHLGRIFGSWWECISRHGQQAVICFRRRKIKIIPYKISSAFSRHSQSTSSVSPNV
mmetsp:Transcript_2113/g.2741  ORF Transcript_2113/g.2741 Transcript_2113/m.2741 type:complete len:104 (+) Transcript_2113:570-881(+)